MHSHPGDFDKAPAPLDPAPASAGHRSSSIPTNLRAPRMPERLNLVLDALDDLDRRIDHLGAELDELE
jgi:hypothetical protein